MRTLAVTTLAIFALCRAHAAELKEFTFTADDWAEGEPPKDVFVVDGTVKVAVKDGNKALVIEPNPITEASAQLASSAAGESIIQARVFGSRRARSMPRFGVSVHGMSGYRLMVTPPKKQIELVKGEQVLQSVPFNWEPDKWLWLRLEVVRGEGDTWKITGKAWPGDGQEPTEPQLKHEDKGLKGQGKAGVWGTPYSEMPIYFDDIKVRIEAAPTNP